MKKFIFSERFSFFDYIAITTVTQLAIQHEIFGFSYS